MAAMQQQWLGEGKLCLCNTLDLSQRHGCSVPLMRVHITSTQKCPFLNWATINSAEVLYIFTIAEALASSALGRRQRDSHVVGQLMGLLADQLPPACSISSPPWKKPAGHCPGPHSSHRSAHGPHWSLPGWLRRSEWPRMAPSGPCSLWCACCPCDCCMARIAVNSLHPFMVQLAGNGRHRTEGLDLPAATGLRWAV